MGLRESGRPHLVEVHLVTSLTSAVFAGDVCANTQTVDEQCYPTVAVLSGGGWVVAWHSRLQDGDGYGVYGQRYDAAGLVVGSEFRINTQAPLDQVLPAVTALRDGGWVVAWASFGQDGSAAASRGIYGQRFTAAGMRLGVNSRSARTYRAPRFINRLLDWLMVDGWWPGAIAARTVPVGVSTVSDTQHRVQRLAANSESTPSRRPTKTILRSPHWRAAVGAWCLPACRRDHS